VSTTSTGRQAETAAADFLQRKGCTIIARNWRTRECEIDIVAQRAGVLYFCEVKYRRTIRQGAGLEYVTPKKVAQMAFAARNWIYAHHWRGPYQLSAIEVSGPQFRVTAAIADVRL
jgi:ribonuclease HII